MKPHLVNEGGELVVEPLDLFLLFRANLVQLGIDLQIGQRGEEERRRGTEGRVGQSTEGSSEESRLKAARSGSVQRASIRKRSEGSGAKARTPRAMVMAVHGAKRA